MSLGHRSQLKKTPVAKAGTLERKKRGIERGREERSTGL
jgi:hypothetical protein